MIALQTIHLSAKTSTIHDDILIIDIPTMLDTVKLNG